jgi:hypothetical protein
MARSAAKAKDRALRGFRPIEWGGASGRRMDESRPARVLRAVAGKIHCRKGALGEPARTEQPHGSRADEVRKYDRRRPGERQRPT